MKTLFKSAIIATSAFVSLSTAMTAEAADVTSIGWAYGGPFNTAPTGMGCAIGYRIKIDGQVDDALGRDYVFIEVVRTGIPAWGSLAPAGLYWVNNGSSVLPALNYSWRHKDGSGNSLTTSGSITFNVYEHDGTTQGPVIWTKTLSPTELQCIPNVAPVANAGSNQSGAIPGNTVTLDGTASTDADGDALTYTWTQVSGPAVTLDNPNSPTPSFTAPGGVNSAPVVFQLVVNDGTANSAPVTVSVGVQNSVAAATAAIGSFLSARNGMILSHQPDVQRRVDRLQGRSGGQAFLRSGNGGASSDLDRPFSVWAEAQIADFEVAGKDGDFDVYYLGGDYMVSDDMLVGVMAQFDKIDYKPNINNVVEDGNGWMVGPYATARVTDDLFLDVRAAYGRSNNTIAPFGTYTDDFDTKRYLMAGTLTGEFELGEALMIRPEGGLAYINEKSESYVDSFSATIPSVTRDQGQVHLGPRIHYKAIEKDDLTVRPYVDARGFYSFGDNINATFGSKTRFRFEGGVDVLSGAIRGSVSYFMDGLGANQFESNGFRITGGVNF